MQAEFTRPLRGVVPPMITPLAGPDELDSAALERLIDHLLAAGVSGLFILGTTGEAPALSYPLRAEIIDRACGHVAGRVPVLVGITDTAFTESIRLACLAATAGASALVAAPPYYFGATQPELLGYFERLVARLPLPLFLYNAPGYTHHSLEPDTVERLAESPNVLGLKDSSGNMIYFHTLLRRFHNRPDFTLLVGPEELMAEAVLLGGHGGICGGANICPRLYVDLYRAAAARDLDSLTELQARVMRISTTVYHVAEGDSAYLRGLKCAVSLMGICGDLAAEPYQAFGPEQRAEVRRHLEAVGLL